MTDGTAENTGGRRYGAVRSARLGGPIDLARKPAWSPLPEGAETVDGTATPGAFAAVLLGGSGQ